jgi:hypothetical protein
MNICQEMQRRSLRDLFQNGHLALPTSALRMPITVIYCWRKIY